MGFSRLRDEIAWGAIVMGRWRRHSPNGEGISTFNATSWPNGIRYVWDGEGDHLHSFFSGHGRPSVLPYTFFWLQGICLLCLYKPMSPYKNMPVGQGRPKKDPVVFLRGGCLLHFTGR